MLGPIRPFLKAGSASSAPTKKSPFRSISTQSSCIMVGRICKARGQQLPDAPSRHHGASPSPSSFNALATSFSSVQVTGGSKPYSANNSLLYASPTSRLGQYDNMGAQYSRPSP